jgi:hypothetical protein
MQEQTEDRRARRIQQNRVRSCLIVMWDERTEKLSVLSAMLYLMFCWPCIAVYQYNDWPCTIVYQYSETNVMHFLFSLLRIKGLYMFRALLAHPQEALHNGTWYTACVLCSFVSYLLFWCLFTLYIVYIFILLMQFVSLYNSRVVFLTGSRSAELPYDYIILFHL